MASVVLVCSLHSLVVYEKSIDINVICLHCRPGYTGLLCDRCAPEYTYVKSEQECLPKSERNGK